MINFRHDINSNAYFDTYLIENSDELKPDVKRPVIVICPGGAYVYTSDREAGPIANAFVSQGYHAIVLRYSVGTNARFPQPLRELAYTVEYLHDHADEMYIDETKIFVAGFSAGGHLAAALCVLWNNSEFLPEFSDRADKIRPAGMILGYPVIDLKQSTEKLDIGVEGYPDYKDIDFNIIYPGTDPAKVYVRENGRTLARLRYAMNTFIFGGDYTAEEEEKLCLQKYVDKNTPPAFIWHGGNDPLIYPVNSLEFANALVGNNVSCELHIFGYGEHGLALANEVTANNPWEIDESCRQWIELAFTWLKRMCTE